LFNAGKIVVDNVVCRLSIFISVCCSAAAEGHGVSRYLLAPFGDRTYRPQLFMARYLAGPSQMSYKLTAKYLALEEPYRAYLTGQSNSL